MNKHKFIGELEEELILSSKKTDKESEWRK